MKWFKTRSRKVQVILLIGLLLVLCVCGSLAFGNPKGDQTPAAPTAVGPTTAGPTAAPKPTDTPKPTDVPKATNTPKPSPTPKPTIAPQTLSGSGQQASSKFPLVRGLAIFELSHSGNSNFAIFLLNDKGDQIDLLVNEIGSFNGSKPLGITASGEYLLDVQADGKWTVTITQPFPPSDAPKPPQTFSGSGPEATAMVYLASGLTTFKMTHDGSGNFAIWLLDSSGQYVDLLVNEIGTFDGSKATGIRTAGAYLFGVEADGNWTLEISQ
jgi:hypothetical protein